MSGWMHEWRLLTRSRMAVAALLLMLALSSLAVIAGMREVERQRETIARVTKLQHDEIAARAARQKPGGDAGYAAYYTFHPTWSPPSSASFLALGLRDTSPYLLRVRALSLQAQLHEGETLNPELALAGRLDFAFVLVYLAPLLLIALLYDLLSSERAAGRLRTLMAMPGGDHRLWLRRAALRSGLLFLCLVVPMAIGAWVSGTSAAVVVAVLLATLVYLLFWAGLALWVAAAAGSSAAKAIVLVGCWTVLVLVLPTLAHGVISRAVPVHQGAELMLAQRQLVHGAWDQPRDETMNRFFVLHPEWRATAPLPEAFHWKWYFAFQQLGDEGVAAQAGAYRHGLLERQRWTERAGWLLPSVAVQNLLHGVAGTDLVAQLDYQDAIARFHRRLRTFYYPYLFNDTAFGPEDFARQPVYEPAPPQPASPGGSLPAVILAAIAVAAGGRMTKRSAASA